MENKYLKRINELAAKNKAEGLTEEELAERDELRKKYIAEFREGFRKNILENTYIQRPNGEKVKLKRKDQ